MNSWQVDRINMSKGFTISSIVHNQREYAPFYLASNMINPKSVHPCENIYDTSFSKCVMFYEWQKREVLVLFYTNYICLSLFWIANIWI